MSEYWNRIDDVSRWTNISDEIDLNYYWVYHSSHLYSQYIHIYYSIIDLYVIINSLVLECTSNIDTNEWIDQFVWIDGYNIVILISGIIYFKSLWKKILNQS